MIRWFVERAPIRTKFKAMALICAASCAAACSYATVSTAGPLPGPIVALVAGVAMAALVLFLGKMIADPYVATVVRMEGLAAGDLHSEVRFTHYTDCVGRMTKAMATFAENARTAATAAEAIRSRAEQAEVVDALSAGLTALANGQLEHRIVRSFPPEYEALRLNFNNAMKDMADAIRSVGAASAGVLTGAEEIHRASDDLAERTERQAASLEQTAAALEQVTGAIRQAAAGAAEANRSAEAARAEATAGGAIVSNAISAISNIEKSSQEIGDIVAMIDGIAFQTNLLALNAGVEAARAGEAGKGFAVVATEVRSLAQRAADAANDVKTRIEASTREVEAGVRLVGSTGDALHRIMAQVEQVSTLIVAIDTAAHAQATSVSQVNAAVGDLDAATQQNAAMVEQASAAARSLVDEANALSRRMERFQVSAEADVRRSPAQAGMARLAA